MKDISVDQKLLSSRPDSPTSSTFSERTMQAVRAAQGRETFKQRIRTTNVSNKEHLLMKLRKHLPIYNRLAPKYLYASLAGVAVIGGTVATVALWPTPKVLQTTLVPLPNGNHIVGYNAQNCDYFDELKSPINGSTNDNIYYEIRKGAPLTDQQLQASLQAVCESNLSNNAVGTIINQLPKKLVGGQSTANYIIKAISANAITVALDSHYDLQDANTFAPGSWDNKTLTHFSSNLLVYNESSRISYSDLQVGDSVVLVIQNAVNPGEPFTDPQDITVYGIMKVPPLTGNPDVFYTSVGKQLVRVEPCKSSPSGFCRAYNFVTPNP